MIQKRVSDRDGQKPKCLQRNSRIRLNGERGICVDFEEQEDYTLSQSDCFSGRSVDKGDGKNEGICI